MDTPDITKMLIEMSKDIQKIKTSLEYMAENCKQERACLEDIDQRVENLETRWAKLDGAWNLILISLGAGVSSFLFAVYQWAKIKFGV